MKIVTRIMWVAGSLFAGVAGAQAFAETWNVVSAGAKGDGSTDNTAVFQQLLDEAGKAGGGVVNVPAGRFRINAQLRIPAHVTLQGIYRVPPAPRTQAMTPLDGSVLLAYAGRGNAEGPPFIQLAGFNSAVIGLIVAYPECKPTDVPPVPYPPCVVSEDTENVGICDCLFLNPYEAIRLIRAHRHNVRNVTGYPIWRGIFVDQCTDIGRIENVHFWPFGVTYKPDHPFCKWVNTHGVAFELARTDWQYVLNTFCFGYGIGYKFSTSKHGSANGNFLGLGADSCQRAMVVEQAQPPGLLISNGEFVGRWGSLDSICLEIGPDVKGKVSLVNCSFWGPVDRCVWMRSPGSQFTASACNFVDWDNDSLGSPAIQVQAGRAIVQGCTFGQENLHVQIGSNVESVILTANQAPAGLNVENAAGRRAQIALNEEHPAEWNAESRLQYRINIGEPGDSRYLRGWQRMERPARWSKPVSQFILPVVPGKSYTITLKAEVPKEALSPDAGLYLNGRQVAPLANSGLLTAILPPCSTDRLQLELRCRGWVPRQVIPASEDGRMLGVRVFAVTMRADGAGARMMDANTGLWLLDRSANDL